MNAPTPQKLFRSASSVVPVGGQAVTAVWGPVKGGMITNPLSPADQGLPNIEVLYVSVVGDATLGQTPDSIELQPGQTYVFPQNSTTNVSVTAASSGHRFSAFVLADNPVLIPQTGDFPPLQPTALLKTINSYLYVQYNDDDDLQAFVRAYNNLTQQYLDWFNQINLPVYTNPNVSGVLLDWVIEGLYTGTERPALSSGFNKNLGPLNTYNLNVLRPSQVKLIGPQNLTVTSDDFYRRIMTWNYYKGDGRIFNVRWLKRRIMRFLLGQDGTAPNVDNSYQVSITFGVGNQVNIRFIKNIRTVTGGSFPGRSPTNKNRPNQLRSVSVNLVPLQNINILKEAIDSGILQLPFQFDYVVIV